MATMPDSLLKDAIEDIGENASVLHRLGLRLLDTAPETANAALAVAQELWEVQKGLSDGRQVKFGTKPSP
ncbi:hypothetical protein [Halomonas sp. JS92-SW72]|uniref:hypothetical protein n=1 Tax=Halomonas sp. JS92-SW72 TaxID=2306583 RepID=UPI000E5ADF8A|nr:hypothetical protein [Halomonas sp. JS92-SW72]AXY44053.1 hypothetical protein D1793_18810 [Halomonas sp. JS92-SW72]